MPEEEISNESSHRDRDENVAVEHHHRQHQPVVENVVEDEDGELFGTFDELLQLWLLKSPCGLGR